MEDSGTLENKLPDMILKRLGYDKAEFDINEFVKSKIQAKYHDEINDRFRKRVILGKVRKKKDAEEKEVSLRRVRPKGAPRVLPKTGLKFIDVKESNSMWIQYMMDYLQMAYLNRIKFSGDPSNRHWQTISSKIAKADFHGAYLSVIRSTLPGYVGIEGIVVIETQNFFQLLGKNNIVKTVQKKLCEFRFVLDGYEFTFFGKDLQVKPTSRAVKKNKTQMFNML